MSDLRELYQQLILDHNKNPRNFRVLDPADRFAKGYNPLCGDKVQIYLQLHGDRIKDIGFQGSGCAISKASASLMTETIKGKTLGETETYFKDFHAMLTDPSSNLGLRSDGQTIRFCRRARLSHPHQMRDPIVARASGSHRQCPNPHNNREMTHEPPEHFPQRHRLHRPTMIPTILKKFTILKPRNHRPKNPRQKAPSTPKP